jgi:hypothetical protein
VAIGCVAFLDKPVEQTLAPSHPAVLRLGRIGGRPSSFAEGMTPN